MSTELLLTNIGYIFSGALVLGLGLLVYIQRDKNSQTGSKTNVVFFWYTILAALWTVTMLLGLDLFDPIMSRAFFNIELFLGGLIFVCNIHLIAVMTDRMASQKKYLIFFYSLIVIEHIVFFINPDLLLAPSQPQLYLHNFLVKGPLYSVDDTIFYAALIYLLIQLFITYRHADYRMRNKLKYFIVAYLIGYALGISPELLLNGINIDPLPAAFSGLYVIPMAYAILKYDAIDLNVFAKRAFGYGLSVGGILLLILFVGYANDTLSASIPGFPVWIVPLLLAMIAVAVGVFIWKKIKEVDTLKFQFVDVVTHKFRTPLTHIRWSIDALKPVAITEDSKTAVNDIASAQLRLLELTNTLVGMTASDDSQYLYQYEQIGVKKLIEEVLPAATERANEKGISLEVNIPEGLPTVTVDPKRIQFVMKMIIENAVVYSPEHSRVVLSAKAEKNFLTISVKDMGIGIAKEDMSRLFSKFFRADSASHAHTEGLGIGLYISRDVIKRHGGTLWADSDGPGKGSIFSFKVPIKID